MLPRITSSSRLLTHAFHCTKLRESASRAAADSHYRNLVVGAGPAGLAVVATLIDGGGGNVLWIDPHFQAGRLAMYSEVPSNTKTKLFSKFAVVSPSLAAVSEPALQPYKGYDPDKGCPLGCAQQMVQRLTESVSAQYSDQVKTQVGRVDSLAYDGGRWQVNGGEASAERVFLATGACPRDGADIAAANKVLPLDDVLVPSRLQGLVTADDVVGVIGSSHSGVLALMNLLQMKNGPRVINFYRSPLRYAIYLEDGRIAYDNTGLKGVAADWARAELETGMHEKSGRLQRVNVKETDPAPAMDTCTKLVNATGLRKNELPRMSLDGQDVPELEHDKHSGCIMPGKLYGFGSAWPEEVIDPIGQHKENNVGLWKFMRYVREALPAQRLCNDL